MLPRIRAKVSIPVGVGFGIRDAASACAVGRGATATAVTEAGSYTVPLLSAGQTLRPGASGICPLQFAQMEGTVGYLILYGLIPLNPDGVTAAQETTSITMEVNYLSPSP